jgi:hypothetical protein
MNLLLDESIFNNKENVNPFLGILCHVKVEKRKTLSSPSPQLGFKGKTLNPKRMCLPYWFTLEVYGLRDLILQRKKKFIKIMRGKVERLKVKKEKILG